MALIIENGTGVANANSYATVTEARTFAAARGVTLSASDPAVEILITKAMDYLSFLAYLGDQVSFDQALPWPRQEVPHPLDPANQYLASNAIPAKLKKALLQLVIEANSRDLMPSGDGRQIIEQKIDVINTKYAEAQSATAIPRFPKVDQWLEGLLVTTGGGFTLTTTRV